MRTETEAHLYPMCEIPHAMAKACDELVEFRISFGFGWVHWRAEWPNPRMDEVMLGTSPWSDAASDA